MKKLLKKIFGTRKEKFEAQTKDRIMVVFDVEINRFDELFANCGFSPKREATRSYDESIEMKFHA